MITVRGVVDVPISLIQAADKIKFQNYKVNRIEKIQKHTENSEEVDELLCQLAFIVDGDQDKFDMVYFSACSGAAPHVDMLDPTKFEDTTYVIPLILPQGDSIIHVEQASVIAETGRVYEFDHTKIHGMTVEDDKSGCVVLMVAVRK